MTDFEKFIEIRKQNKQNGVYILNDSTKLNEFADLYHKLREKEGRVYDDEILRKLPEISKSHSLYKEWRIRSNSADKLLSYLSWIQSKINVLDLGCGNGWLTNKISKLNNVRVMGVDVNKQKLEQAARVFGNDRDLVWVYADVFAPYFSDLNFDMIILGGSIMYFKDAKSLINRLLSLLSSNGELHIFDSPLYTADDVKSAKERSRDYYISIGFPEMIAHFHHHTLEEIQDFNLEIIYNPNTVLNKIMRCFLIRYISPFRWLKIKKNKSPDEFQD